MRLGKEQAVGVVETPARADSILRDETSAGDAEQAQFAEEVVGDASPVSGLSEQGALIRSR
jgi:hypothetical protein